VQFWLADPNDPDFSVSSDPAVNTRDIVQAPGLVFHLLKKVVPHRSLYRCLASFWSVNVQHLPGVLSMGSVPARCGRTAR
jgi:hypothetical protein